MRLIRLIVMAKAPLANKVKTRLIPALDADAAAELARKMLLHTLYIVQQANIGVLELSLSLASEDYARRKLGIDKTVIISSQGDGDLGQRLERIAQRTYANNEMVIFIGSDCPSITTTHLQTAAKALQQQADCSLIPTYDGGYALLGLKNKYPPHASLFHVMPWSTDAVMAITLQRLQQLKWCIHTQDKLHDIDEPKDLQHLVGVELHT
ncbi:MAG: TIGR04282 family arsenosugar biosynthesis glycosyltransferase [Mariprofundales bacterium]